MGKYKLWNVQECVQMRNVVSLKFSTNTHLVSVASLRVVEVLLLSFKSTACERLIVYHADFDVEDIKWSPDSKALLIVSFESCQFVVLEIIKGKEFSTFRVQEPTLVNLLTVEWAPDSKHVLSICKHNVFTFVHNVYDGQRILLPATCLSNSGETLKAFSPDGKYLVSITYLNSAFHTTLISTLNWLCLWNKKLEHLEIQGVEWCPKSSLIAVWDSSQTISFIELCGETVMDIQYRNMSKNGFLTTLFSPESNLLIAPCLQHQDIQILVYNLFTWRLGVALEHTQNDKETVHGDQDYKRGYGDSSQTLTHPFHIKSQLAFSFCGSLLASSLLRGLVNVWNLKDECRPIKVFHFENCYAGLKWHPFKSKLALTTNTGEAYIWKLKEEDLAFKEASVMPIHPGIKTACSITWCKRKLIFCSLKRAFAFSCCNHKQVIG